tara:strand:+ start:83 stop:490 length:408 start_codon:yes stop_codon:yes gene_type:complete
MKYLLTTEESEKLYPGLKDMPKGEIPEDARKDFGQMKGEGNPNWKDGISLDRKSYRALPEQIAKRKEYRQRPEVKEKDRKRQQTPEIKAKQKERNRIRHARPENIAKRHKYNQTPKYKAYKKEYNKRYRENLKQK